MNKGNPQVFAFGPYMLSELQHVLTRNGEPVKLPPKSFELLAFFVRHPNQVITKEKLMDEVWADAVVEDANLTVHISNVRKVLGSVDGPEEAKIETIPKVGYRFRAEVAEIETDESGSESDPQPTSKKAVAGEPFLNGHRLLGLLLTLGFALLIFGVTYFFGFGSSTSPTQPEITHVPKAQNSNALALAPNGEYIAHTFDKWGKAAVMLMNIQSNSEIELLPAEEGFIYYGLRFSPDSSHLYIIRTRSEVLDLYRMPVLGREAEKILENVGADISFSPDGSRFCFSRKIDASETGVFIANSDGSNVSLIAKRTAPDFYESGSISWSPKGDMIAVIAGRSMTERSARVIGIDVETGEEHLLSEMTWAAGDGMSWLKDGSGLVAALFETSNAPTQLWYVPYPAGLVRRITNDSNNYGRVSISSDSSTILTGEFSDESSLWKQTGDDALTAEPVTNEKHHQFKWVRWTADGRVIFGSSVGDNRDVWRMDPNGRNATQVTKDSGSNVMPVASADGQYYVFASNRSDDKLMHLWRTNTNGSEPTQLTFEGEQNQPEITPDGREVFYTEGKIDGVPQERTVWRIGVNGVGPTRFTSFPAYGADVSPDGKQVLCWVKPDAEGPWKIGIFSVNGGNPLQLLTIPSGVHVRWTSDGKGVSFVKTAQGASNIWTMPLAGGEPYQVTQFPAERIFGFDWSSDGRLVCSRLFKRREAVLIRNFRSPAT
jgi:Tol biopolymer transport system component/DNA-binding winged helix-turn-helix (wHTH) protein